MPLTVSVARVPMKPRDTESNRSVQARRRCCSLESAQPAEHFEATYFKPQLALPAKRAPAGDQWLHEIKVDGYRLIAVRNQEHVRLLTRSEQDWTSRFPTIARAIADLHVDSIALDGEVASVDSDGRTSFKCLQRSIRRNDDHGLVYFAFDLLHLNGEDCSRMPLMERKQLLQYILASDSNGYLRFTDHVQGQGDEVHQAACHLGLEGIVSKRADATYTSGRSESWRKIKCIRRQEFVVIGLTEPEGTRKHFGAFLLGAHDGGGKLRYTGRVGTGFDASGLASIASRLKPLWQSGCPADVPPAPHECRGVQWVCPKMVVEVRFTEWTEEQRLRHSSFLGVREDKEAGAVMIGSEQADALSARTTTQSEQGSSKRSRRRLGHTSDGQEEDVRIAGVRISNADRVLYPEQGLTKRELAQYYERVADRMLPYIRRRPLSTVRCPKGRGKHCFFQKHMRESFGAEVTPVAVSEDSGKADYIGVDSLPGLISLIQFGVLEIHPWGASGPDLSHPDRLVFDLDLGIGVSFGQIINAAEDVRVSLKEVDLNSYVMATGGKGVHVVVPLARRAEWDDAKAFSRDISGGLVAAQPDRYVATMRKARRQGRVFIDFFRNSRGATAIAPYSTRARPGAPVAMPLRWEELSEIESADAFTVTNARHRLVDQADPWDGFFRSRQQLTHARLEHVRLQRPATT